ncbi:MAG: hypothetical protein SFX18_09190 [Pirellulales bacterium]|nr:hypothetical protein [Pirellulales bacterium]
MKTTTFSFALSLAMAGLSSLTVAAAGPATTPLMQTARAIPTQTGDSRREADELLKQARKALDAGNYQTAESYLDRAERLNPQYSALHFGDTPKKLRDELAKRQTPVNASDPVKTGFLGMGKESPRDPFLNRTPSQPVVGVAPQPINPAATGQMPPTGGSAYTTDGIGGVAGQPAGSTPSGTSNNGLTAPRTLPYDTINMQPLAAANTPPRVPAGTPGVQNAGGFQTAPGGPVTQSIYSGLNDPTRVQPATYNAPATLAPLPGQLNAGTAPIGAQSPRPETLPPGTPQQGTLSSPQRGAIPAQATEPTSGQGMQLIQQGEQALQAGQADQALRLFREAYQYQNELDANTRSRLQDHLQMLSRPALGTPTPGVGTLTGAENSQQILIKQVSADISRVQTESRKLWEEKRDPKRAIEILEEAKAKYAAAPGLDQVTKDQIQARLDLSLTQAKQFLENNKAQLALDEKNQAVRDAVDAQRDRKIQIDEKLVLLVDEFNKLIDEHRFAEAEVTAKKAQEIAPDELITQQLVNQAKMLRRLDLMKSIRDEKERAIFEEFASQEIGAIPFSGEIKYPDEAKWRQLTDIRTKFNQEIGENRSPREREIQQKLNTPILMKFEQTPLRSVIEYLEKTANINIHLDPQGMAAEGVTSDEPVTLKVNNEIRLVSALDLILSPIKMGYVIKNDVLLITSLEKTRGQVYSKSYPVADLVIPIPNFVPTGREGLVGGLDTAYEQANRSRRSLPGFAPPAPLSVAAAGDGNTANAMMHPSTLAQIQQNAFNNNGLNNGPPATGFMQPMNFGPGGMGGGAQADFDALIELITTTVQPDSWKENGGQGGIAPFETNLTLVVSNTQEVHEKIADLLQQLRRLQDLQVTIEVRFITLSDNFFERIGVDFDFTIDDNVTFAGLNSDIGPSSVIGLGSTGQPTPTLNIPFTQGSFNATQQPPVAGITFDPATAGSFGFAILSDIEAFFLIQAAVSDTRSNILQAPKVTLFNGQSAFISDTSQRPFVTSVIPVVGDFAAAQQPVIVVLSEGTSLTVQAVVSNDRRFVRLTVVPFFSQIGDVEEFTFEGSKTSTTKSSDSSSGSDDSKAKTSEKAEFEEGTTVQLPTFSFVTVTTTVSVPDGGTVLLGGIKRLAEGRDELGIPILSKIPYINRLFKNVSIARSTQSLMLMVTPRIIIQEEEEEKLIGAPSTP